MEQLNLRENLERLIQKYREMPCLWDARLPSYHKTDVRTKALNQVATYMQTCITECTGIMIREKINNIRGTYRKAYRKLHKPQRSGAAARAAKEPKLWYYTDLSFLEDQMEGRDSLSSLPSTLPSRRRSTRTSMVPSTPAECEQELADIEDADLPGFSEV